VNLKAYFEVLNDFSETIGDFLRGFVLDIEK
jgi:hypothetical protein